MTKPLFTPERILTAKERILSIQLDEPVSFEEVTQWYMVDSAAASPTKRYFAGMVW